MEPRFVLLENVSALLTRGIDDVLGTLASIGFDAEWHCIPAAAVGASHIRDRVFILADADGMFAQGERTGGESLARARLQKEKPQGLGDGIGKQWAIEPDVGRVANGVPKRVDRLRGLGNAVVPQVAEWIGWQIVNMEPNS
jgi:DNA (cytosine-5)-methyltransferase 1